MPGSTLRIKTTIAAVFLVAFGAWAINTMLGLRGALDSLPSLPGSDPQSGNDDVSAQTTADVFPSAVELGAISGEVERSSLEATDQASQPAVVADQEAIDTQRETRQSRTPADSPLLHPRLADPILQPLPLPTEFDWIKKFPYLQLDRELLQREPIDIAWASETEAQLKSYIYEHTELAQEYGNPTVHCRTTRCEVTFIRNGLEEWNSLSSEEFVARVEPFFDLPEGAQWPYGTSDGVFNIHAWNEDGVTTLHWTLAK